MPVGELFLSAFLQVLFDRLACRELLQFARKEGIRSKLKKWEKKLMMIQAVLSDAEEKQLTNRAVKIWLDELRDLAYDVEDILDEFATEASSRKLSMGEHQASTSKVRKVLPAGIRNWSPKAVKFNIRMRSQIKAVSSRLEGLCKLRDDFGLKEITGGSSSNGGAQRPPSTSVQIEPAVYGRDADKAKILEWVLRDDEPGGANFQVISIVGMGGIGKTTLAREVYNDEVVKSFELKAWACVSDDFDILRISKAILESIISRSCDLNDLNAVQIQLKQQVAGKRFLLVLDDVWSKNYSMWEILRSPFMVGAPGSKMIVTTRLEDVALTMGSSTECYKLKFLADDDCWSLFKKHAYQREGISGHQNMELIHQKVIEKCRGLPLAAKTLGGLLRSKQRYDEWLNILNSKIWDSVDETDIPATLKLSYHYLPSHLKRCFSYCAILPKDYEFEKEELIPLWIAEGLIQKSKENEDLEDLGHEYFCDLLLRSIFQQSSIHKSKYIMHDLVSDLAKWVSGETCFTLEDTSMADKQLRSLKKVRHFSYSSSEYEGKSKFEVISKGEQAACLRTLSSFSFSWRDLSSSLNYITPTIIHDLMLKFQKLRVLSLKGYYITELPESVGHLRHLRYLNLSFTKIISLPESTCSLINLQIMKLRHCNHLKKLPSRMSNLINLCHLDIRGTNLNEMPFGMKKMKYLRNLTSFYVGKDVGADVKDLKALKFLRNELHILRLENVTDSYETKEKILNNTNDLKVLQLEWGSKFDDTRNQVMEKTVLDMLQPHPNLEELYINSYGGVEFPSWLGNSSFSNMTVLKLENCENCTSVPSLGLLSSLKDLTIIAIKELKCIGSDFYGKGCPKAFQSLKTLYFENLPEWELWEPIKENAPVEVFPCLQKLSIMRCPKLSGRLPDHLPSLEELVIEECQQLVVSISSIPMLSKLSMDGCKGMACNSPIDFKSLKSVSLSYMSEFDSCLRPEFQKVESVAITVTSCDQLMILCQNEIFLENPLQGLQSLAFLRELCILNCLNLVTLPEACILSNLSKLSIHNCIALTSLPVGMKHNNARLEQLAIYRCNSLTFIVSGRLPSSIKKLDVQCCTKLEYLWDDGEESCTCSFSVAQKDDIKDSSTSLLQTLFVSDCPSLKFLSPRGQLPGTLLELYISYVPKLESITERFLSNASLETIDLYRCENLKSLPEGLHNLSRLRDINIQHCPSIVCFPAGGLPNTNLRVFIHGCRKLKVPSNHFHSLNSLQHLEIKGCPSITCFPEEGLLSKLTSLEIKDVDIHRPLLEWGLHRLTSLTTLEIIGSTDAESFPQMGMMLPPSLSDLTIASFKKLRHLCSLGFQNLTSLKILRLEDCPNLLSFPEHGLPPSLVRLDIWDCPLLKEESRRGKGKEWPKISDIPCVYIDDRFIHDPEERTYFQLTF